MICVLMPPHADERASTTWVHCPGSSVDAKIFELMSTSSLARSITVPTAEKLTLHRTLVSSNRCGTISRLARSQSGHQRGRHSSHARDASVCFRMMSIHERTTAAQSSALKSFGLLTAPALPNIPRLSICAAPMPVL